MQQSIFFPNKIIRTMESQKRINYYSERTNKKIDMDIVTIKMWFSLSYQAKTTVIYDDKYIVGSLAKFYHFMGSKGGPPPFFTKIMGFYEKDR